MYLHRRNRSRFRLLGIRVLLILRQEFPARADLFERLFLYSFPHLFFLYISVVVQSYIYI